MDETADWIPSDIVPDRNLGAIFITSAFFPPPEILAHYLSAVEEGGVFIAEMDYQNLFGASSNDDDTILRSYIQTAGFMTADVLERNQLLMQHLPLRRIPKVYRFRKNAF